MIKDEDTEIRVLTLRFPDAQTVMQFDALAQRHGYQVCHSKDGRWYKVTIYFQNKAERSTFLRAWAKESIHDPDKYQGKLL